MKPRRPTAVLLLFVAALATWLAIRPRPIPPPSVGKAPEHHEDASSPLASPTPPAIVPVPAASGTPSSAAFPPTPAYPESSLAVTDVSPRAEPAGAPSPGTANPSVSREDTSLANAIRVRRMVTDYHTLTGENPVGTNAEIMAALMGKNLREAVLGPPDGIELNRQGELVDEWGTPYFFHQLSRDLMEIHSAGPDKIMGTPDDIVVR